MNEQSIMTNADPAPGMAGAGGEYVRPSGMHYLRFLRRLHQACLFNWYFEVGTCTGDSLVLSRSKSIAVDPFFRVGIENNPVHIDAGQMNLIWIKLTVVDNFLDLDN